MVESIIDIGRNMALDLVAEGVETEIQRDILIHLGCRAFQGRLFSRAPPEPSFLRWINADAAARESNAY